MPDPDPTIVAETPATPPRGAARLLPWLVLVLSILILWHSAGNHPLYSPDEGRYGTASMHMADGGSWIIPWYRGEAHLTKPPLTYWVQALSLRMLGHGELGLRAPSLLAGSLTVLLLFLTTRRLAGSGAAALATGTLVMMPLYMLVNRLATTDAMLTFFWFAAIVCGCFTVTTGRGIWPVLMWAAIACGLLTKGPLALVPVGLLLIWLLLAENARGIGRLRILIGFALSILPIILWVLLVLHEDRGALETWRHEMLDRVTGNGGAHPEAVYFYVPYFLVGLFPATGMLTVPGWNLTWRAAWQKLRTGEPAALFAIAVVAPLLMFTLFSGKLVTYLLPLCAPLALLNGVMLSRWLTGQADRPAPQTRPPEVVATLAISAILGIGAMMGVAAWLKPELLRFSPPLLLMPLACLWTWRIWKRRPRRRAMGLLVVYLTWMLGWCCTFAMEDKAHEPHSAAACARRLQSITDAARPDIYLFGFTDPTLSFYNRKEVERIYRISQVEAIARREDSKGVALLIDRDAVEEFRERFHRAAALQDGDSVGASRAGDGQAAAFTCVGRWDRSITHTTAIFIPTRRARKLEAVPFQERFDPGN